MQHVGLFVRLLFLSVLLLSSKGVVGQKDRIYTPQTVPDPMKSGGGYVSDPGNVLSSEEMRTLNQLIGAMEDSTTAQAAVVVLPSIGEESPKEFATALFAEWGIGQQEVDNGLLILVVMDQRRTEFETGYGLEAVLPDITCYKVGMEELVPFFQQQAYGKGLIAAVTRFKTILENPEVAAEIYAGTEGGTTRSRSNPFPWILGIYGLLNGIVHLIILIIMHGVLNGKQDLYDKYKALQKANHVFWLVLFPIPFVFVFLWAKRRLKQLRMQPRYSLKTGELMHLASDTEEDAYLKKGQITEEEIGAADYDVWVTETGSEALILRYARMFHRYKTCPECRFMTYSLTETHTIRSATRSQTGLKENIYHCKNCNVQRREEVVIPMITSSPSSSGSGGGGGGSWGGGSSGGGGAGVSW